MFHDVKIFNANGELKKVVTSEELSRTYWENFQLAEDKVSLISTGRASVPKWVREKLDVEFMEFVSSS